MKITALDGLDASAVERLRELSGVDLVILNDAKTEQKLAAARESDIILIRSATRVTKEFLKETPKLKLVVRAGIGLDNVDVPEATKAGVIVMNTPFGNRVTTAEHALAMMMSLMRHIPQATASMKAGQWEKKKFMGRELCRKVLGVVGLGNIGQIVADRAVHLGMNVIAYDPFVTAEAASKMGVEKVDLETLFYRSEIITIHVPLTEQTKYLINEKSFEKMKSGVYLIHCARGGIVKESALVDALESGKVAGAALDVFEEEPPQANNPLVKHPKVICTPHLGAATDEAQIAVSIEAAEQIVDFVKNGNIRNAVNHPNIQEARLRVLGGHLGLAERLGAYLGQWVFGEQAHVSQVDLKYQGIDSQDKSILTLSFLKGFLEPICAEGVNFVNARAVATAHDIRVVESSGDLSTDFVQLIEATVTRDGEKPLNLAGTLFGKIEPRIVTVNEFKTDAKPDGWILVTINKDVPKMIGKIGSILGDHDVNIATMNLGRGRDDTELAFAMTSVDSQIPDEALNKLRKTTGIELVKQFHIKGSFT